MNLHAFDTLSSTNDKALELIAQGAKEGVCVTSKVQMKGRGRQGRVWVSEAGNLYLSIILYPPFGSHVFQLSFVAALAILTALKLPNISLKWPNDILLNRKKLAGILLEKHGSAVIVGIGVNLAHSPENTMFPATSLIEEGCDIPLDAVRTAVIEQFFYWYEMWKSQGFMPVRTYWLEHAEGLGKKITVGGREGIFEGIDEQGALLLDGVPITYGDVS